MTNAQMDIEQHPTEEATIQQEKLNTSLQAYVAFLVVNHPFTKDIKVDARRVTRELSDTWPKFPEWSAQERELIRSIDSLVRSLPTISTVPDILIRVVAGAAAMAPALLPEPDEATVIATFDAVDGVMKKCILTGSGQLMSALGSLAIPSGVMVICQHMAPLNNRYVDNRPLNYGSGENEYSQRTNDPVLRRGEGWDEKGESVTGPPNPNLYPPYEHLSPQYPNISVPPREILMEQQGLDFWKRALIAGGVYAAYRWWKNRGERNREEQKRKDDLKHTDELKKEENISTLESINGRRRQAYVSVAERQKMPWQLSRREESIIAITAEKMAATERSITISPENSSMTARRPELLTPYDQMTNAADVETRTMALQERLPLKAGMQPSIVPVAATVAAINMPAAITPNGTTQRTVPQTAAQPQTMARQTAGVVPAAVAAQSANVAQAPQSAAVANVRGPVQQVTPPPQQATIQQAATLQAGVVPQAAPATVNRTNVAAQSVLENNVDATTAGVVGADAAPQVQTASDAVVQTAATAEPTAAEPTTVEPATAAVAASPQDVATAAPDTQNLSPEVQAQQVAPSAPLSEQSVSPEAFQEAALQEERPMVQGAPAEESVHETQEATTAQTARTTEAQASESNLEQGVALEADSTSATQVTHEAVYQQEAETPASENRNIGEARTYEAADTRIENNMRQDTATEQAGVAERKFAQASEDQRVQVGATDVLSHAPEAQSELGTHIAHETVKQVVEGGPHEMATPQPDIAAAQNIRPDNGLPEGGFYGRTHNNHAPSYEALNQPQQSPSADANFDKAMNEAPVPAPQEASASPQQAAAQTKPDTSTPPASSDPRTTAEVLASAQPSPMEKPSLNETAEEEKDDEKGKSGGEGKSEAPQRKMTPGQQGDYQANLARRRQAAAKHTLEEHNDEEEERGKQAEKDMLAQNHPHFPTADPSV